MVTHIVSYYFNVVKTCRILNISCTILFVGLGEVAGVAVDPKRGKLYVSDTCAHTMQVINLDTLQRQKAFEGQHYGMVVDLVDK